MNIELNPEAKEFKPSNFQSSIEDGLVKINKSARSSNSLPSGSVYLDWSSYTDFAIVTSNFRHNVKNQINAVFRTEVQFKLGDNDEYNTERLIDANDGILDRIYKNIDCVRKGTQPDDQRGYERQVSVRAGTYHNPVITKIQVGGITFIGGKNIVRPQLLFKDVIDNSHNLWMPKISDKPHNITPLVLEILYNDEGEAIGYEHPYKEELSQFRPRPEWLTPDPEPPTVPPSLSNTTLTTVDTEEGLDELIRHLQTVEELAVDLEHHNFRSYQGFTCLIQITTSAGDFIVDAIILREHLHRLNLIFTNPKILKVFHGANMDVLWLQRDFGVYVVGMFDTHKAACLLNISSKTLQSILQLYCSVETNKTFQQADWRFRPLSAEMIQYARTDTHYLLYIARRMKADLLKKNDGEPDLLLKVFTISQQVCGLTYNKPQMAADSHLSLYHRSKRTFNAQQMAALRLLYKWRDDQARELDESTMYLLPNHMLLTLAERLPREVQGVSAICSPMPPFVKQNLVVIHRMLLSCRELSLESQLMTLDTNNTFEVQAPMLEHDVHDFEDDGEDNDVHAQEETASGKRRLWPVLTTKHVALKPCVEDTPDIPMFLNEDNCTTNESITTGDVLFPYDRYKEYRTLAWAEEMKLLQEKQAKVAAIAQGNELIKAEIMTKLQEIKEQVIKESRASAQGPENGTSGADPTQNVHQPSDATPTSPLVPPSTPSTASNTRKNRRSRAFAYSNSNYNRFRNDENTSRK